MSARDAFHDAVKTALIKDGWTITADPLRVEVEGFNISIDLAAEQIIAADRDGQYIAVEIKSFLESASAVSEFHRALGQFLNYRTVLKRSEPERVLYLAVPKSVYETFFQLTLPKIQVEEFELKLVVYNPNEETIQQWNP